MYTAIPYKQIETGSISNKKRRFGKPWWSVNLTELWNKVCEAEGTWLLCTSKSDKFNFKTQYVAAR